jgi:hypothetical protein
MVNDQLFLAVNEASDDCERTKGKTWQSTTFNVYEMGSEEAVRYAFERYNKIYYYHKPNDMYSYSIH